jgi:hypothetical protein
MDVEHADSCMPNPRRANPTALNTERQLWTKHLEG